MFSGQRLRELVRERLAAAAEEIITEFEQITNHYEEEINRQKRLLNMHWCSQIKIHRIGFPQESECNDNEVLAVHQLWNQEMDSSLDQEEQDAAQVPEEEEQLCTSHEEEHFELKQETDTVIVTSTDEDNDNSETEPSGHPRMQEPLPGTD
ncbi:uncharacterized protein KZ484_011855 isoform 2-T2 [Pholidichthys leucotaenia]